MVYNHHQDGYQHATVTKSLYAQHISASINLCAKVAIQFFFDVCYYTIVGDNVGQYIWNMIELLNQLKKMKFILD